MKDTAVIFFGLLLAGLAGFSGYLYGKVSNVEKTVAVAPTPAPQPAKVTVTMEQVKALFTEGNIALGNKDSKLLFVEFSDPSCPFCHVAAGKNGQLNKQMGAQFTLKADGGTYVPPVPEIKKLVDAGKAGFVWLYANGHGNGEMGTKAIYCAQEKGKFWEVHDLLMSEAGYTLMNTTVKNDKTQSKVVADFLKKAVEANFMKTCLDSGKYDGRMNQDMAIARQFGFQGTPDFFVNTTNFSGAQNFMEMQSTVNAVLN